MTLRHLLSMTSGLKGRSRRGQSVGYVADKNPFVIGLSLSWEPGTRWSYSNEGVQLLSPILDRAAGEPIQDYARRRLFEPLGMMDTRLHVDVAGHAWTYADMETTPRDLARLGILMLERGRWGGQQIVSTGWIEQSIGPSQELNPAYGLLWWRIDDPPGFMARVTWTRTSTSSQSLSWSSCACSRSRLTCPKGVTLPRRCLCSGI